MFYKYYWLGSMYLYLLTYNAQIESKKILITLSLFLLKKCPEKKLESENFLSIKKRSCAFEGNFHQLD